jgi:hypothetical protein
MGRDDPRSQSFRIPERTVRKIRTKGGGMNADHEANRSLPGKPGSYDLDVGRFLREHPDTTLQAGPGGSGYRAQRRDGRGRGVGVSVIALTLDELDAQLGS